MDWNKICTDYYKAGYYNAASLKVFVVKGKITADQYQAITGQAYSVS